MTYILWIYDQEMQLRVRNWMTRIVNVRRDEMRDENYLGIRREKGRARDRTDEGGSRMRMSSSHYTPGGGNKRAGIHWWPEEGCLCISVEKIKGLKNVCREKTFNKLLLFLELENSSNESFIEILFVIVVIENEYYRRNGKKFSR